MDVRRFARVEPGIFSGIFFSSAGGWQAARLTARCCSNMALVWLNRLLPLGASAGRELQYQTFKRRIWATSVSNKAYFCTSEFIWMNPTLWNDQNMFLTTLKIWVYPKTLLFSDEQGSNINCWREKPLVVALEYLEGFWNKHTILF